MTTRAWIPIPGHTLDALLRIPGSGALRTLLVICSAVQNGVAQISARDIAARARLTERSVFIALAQLESANCIARESRDPGPQANEIRLIDREPQHTVQYESDATSGSQSSGGNTLPDDQQDISMLIGSCFRKPTGPEIVRAHHFVAEHFDSDIEAFARAIGRLRNAGGVAHEASFGFCLGAIEAAR